MSANHSPLIYLIVLNWNGFEDTHACLLSLRDITYTNHRILVVDNHSSDDSPALIAQQHPEVELIHAPDNRGIAAGYNIGMRAALEAGADYVVPMNNDIEFDPAFLDEMLAAQQRWSNCGVVMPKIYYFDEPNVIWSNGGYMRWSWMPSNILLKNRTKRDTGQFEQEMEIRFAPSCCLLITREAAEQVLFDEDYFFYFDDWDYCKLVRDLGYSIVFAPKSKLWHKVSRSTQNSPRGERWWKILGQSCVRFHRKHHSSVLLALYVTWVVIRESVKLNFKVLPHFLAGIRSGVRAKSLEEMQPGWTL